MFGEGSTWIIPEFVGENYMRIKEFGTPIIQNIQYTYTEPKRVLLGAGESAKLGDGTVTVVAFDEMAGTVTVEITDKDGKAESRVLGPLDEHAHNLLPQHQDIVNKLQFVDRARSTIRVMAEMVLKSPLRTARSLCGLMSISSTSRTKSPCPPMSVSWCVPTCAGTATS